MPVSKKKSKAPKSSSKVNRSELIRKYPDLSPADVIAKVKEAHGVKVSAALVYNIRSVAKKAGSGTKAQKVTRTKGERAAGGGLEMIRQIAREVAREEIERYFSAR